MIHGYFRPENFFFWRTIQVPGLSAPTHGLNEPFGRIPMVETGAVAVIPGLPMMKIVVSLAEGKQRRDPTIPGCIFVRIGLRANHMSEGINHKSEMVACDQADEAAKYQSAPWIAEEGADRGRKSKTDSYSYRDPMTVLPGHKGIFLKVSRRGSLVRLIIKDPSDMRPKGAGLNVVRIKVGIDKSVMQSMVTRPTET
jgi:hypothetical protein